MTVTNLKPIQNSMPAFRKNYIRWWVTKKNHRQNEIHQVFDLPVFPEYADAHLSLAEKYAFWISRMSYGPASARVLKCLRILRAARQIQAKGVPLEEVTKL